MHDSMKRKMFFFIFYGCGMAKAEGELLIR